MEKSPQRRFSRPKPLVEINWQGVNCMEIIIHCLGRVNNNTHVSVCHGVLIIRNAEDLVAYRRDKYTAKYNFYSSMALLNCLM